MSNVQNTASSGDSHRVLSLQTFVAVGAAWIGADIVAPDDLHTICASLPVAAAVVALCTILLRRATKRLTRQLLHNGPTLCTFTATTVDLALDGVVDAKTVIIGALALASLIEVAVLPYLHLDVLVVIRLATGKRAQAVEGQLRGKAEKLLVGEAG